MSVGELGDGIRAIANGLPLGHLEVAHESVDEALYIATETLEGHTAQEAQDVLDNLTKALQGIENLQDEVLPEIRRKMYAIANRLGTLAGDTSLSPLSGQAETSQLDPPPPPLPQMPKLAEGFAPYDFSQQEDGGQQVIEEAIKVFKNRDIEEIESELADLPDKFKLEKDGRTVGFLGGALTSYGRWAPAATTYSIHFMTILPGERGGMYALEMLAEAERRARIAGAVAIEFFASDAVKRVCGRWGYVEDPEFEGQSTNSMRKVL